MKTDKTDIQSEITKTIALAIERGAGQFTLPWHQKGLKFPVNAVSCKRYRGINFLNLLLAAQANGYHDGRWATFRQWQELGAIVRKGERGTPVIFYKILTADPCPDNSDEGKEAFHFMRHTHAFNVAQVDGLQNDKDHDVADIAPVMQRQNADAVIAATRAVIRHEGQAAYYRPSTDEITMPPLNLWCGSETSSPTEAYYSTLFHELVHWTGAPKRLSRFTTAPIFELDRAREELVAEMGAAFLCIDLGITPSVRADHAAYIAQYLELLKSDRRAIFWAASRASKAFDFIMEASSPYLRD